MASGGKKAKPEPIRLTKQELQNLINIVATHPTPDGVGSQSGNLKIVLINKLSIMKDQAR